MTERSQPQPEKPSSRASHRPPVPPPASPALAEIGGPPGPEPTRYGDWQYNGRCTDF